MLKGRASSYYYNHIAGHGYDFDTMKFMVAKHFETEENRLLYMSMWRETTFERVIEKNPTKNKLKCLQLLFDKLQKIQRGLGVEYQSDTTLRDQTINACRGVPECNFALYKPAINFESVCAELRSAVGTTMRSQGTQQFETSTTPQTTNDEDDQFWTDRTYGGRGGNRGRGGGQRGGFRGGNRDAQRNDKQLKCYVCKKTGCWFTNHSLEKRRKAWNGFKDHARDRNGREPTTAYYQGFLAQYEGVEGLEDTETNDVDQILQSLEIEEGGNDMFMAELGEVDGTQTMSILDTRSTLHAVTKEDGLGEERPSEYSAFTFTDRYSSDTFQGIMPDTGAAGVSTAGRSQFLALQKIDSSVQLDTTTAGEHKIRFGKGDPILSEGTIHVKTPVGVITFHVLATKTPFLFCVQDINRIGVKLDN